MGADSSPGSVAQIDSSRALSAPLVNPAGALPEKQANGVLGTANLIRNGLLQRLGRSCQKLALFGAGGDSHKSKRLSSDHVTDVVDMSVERGLGQNETL